LKQLSNLDEDDDVLFSSNTYDIFIILSLYHIVLQWLFLLFIIFYISCAHFVMFIDMSLRNKLWNFECLLGNYLHLILLLNYRCVIINKLWNFECLLGNYLHLILLLNYRCVIKKGNHEKRMLDLLKNYIIPKLYSSKKHLPKARRTRPKTNKHHIFPSILQYTLTKLN